MNQIGTNILTKKTLQINIRLAATSRTKLADLIEWLKNQKYVEFLGKEEIGRSITTSETTFARYLLVAAIDHMYSELEAERLIDELGKRISMGEKLNQIEKYLKEEYKLIGSLAEEIILIAKSRLMDSIIEESNIQKKEVLERTIRSYSNNSQSKESYNQAKEWLEKNKVLDEKMQKQKEN